MEKTSKVTRATANGTWNSNYGMLYRFEVEFENGDVGEYLSKKAEQTMFKVGESMMYTLDGKEYNGKMFYKIKPIPQQPPTAFPAKVKDPETDKRITRMSVLKVAGDLAINGSIQLQEVLAYAQIFEQYVITGADTLSKFRPMNNNDVPF
jgi:hypothetical protein